MDLDIRLQHLYAQRDYLHMQVAQQYTPYGSATLVLPEPDAEDLLQAYWLAPTPEAHVARLLDIWALPPDAHVLDCGCGTGSFTRFAQQIRPDVHWSLLGHDAAQLAQCHTDTSRLRGDMHHLPLRANSYDGVLLAYVLGYGFAPAVLEEVSRVLKPGGALLWYDLAADDGQADHVLVTLGYQAYPVWRVRQLALHAGLQCAHIERVPMSYPAPAWKEAGALRLFFEQEITPVCHVWRKDG